MIKNKKTNIAIGNILKLIGNPESKSIFIYTSKGKYDFAKQIYDNLNIFDFQGHLILLDNVLNKVSINTFREQLLRIIDDYGIMFFIEPEYGKLYFDIFGCPDFGHKLNPRYFFSDLFLPVDNLIRMYGIDLTEEITFKRNLKSELEGASLIEITTDLGTDISIHPRSWSSTAVGEIYTAPIEYIAEGNIVIDGCAYFGPPQEQFILELKKGRVVNINTLNKNDYQQNMVIKDLKRDKNANVLAELGLGINPGALWNEEVMEAECARGTCHFGFGHNIEYGGRNKSSYHFDLVVKEPTIIVDGKIICSSRKYLIR